MKLRPGSLKRFLKIDKPFTRLIQKKEEAQIKSVTKENLQQTLQKYKVS